ncbi:hypothetical protein B9N43_09335 [Denitratisoma sp. DHT3]|nr:hypothetical protein B9N43_09335 [Denitratisoma sp. DHT3]
MNLVSDLLLLAGIASLAWAGLHAFQRLPLFPLRQVVIQGELQQVTRMQLEYAVKGSVSGNFFTVNLESVRGAFEKLPWVRRAEVRRVWPDALELTIEEQKAVARWRRSDGEYRLVNHLGEVFIAAAEQDLPDFSGPEGSAAQILERYREFSAALTEIGHQARAVHLSPRQAWQLRLDDGLVLELGREEAKHPVKERLERFAANYRETLQLTRSAPGMIDMRYPNGFALRSGHADKAPQT